MNVLGWLRQATTTKNRYDEFKLTTAERAMAQREERLQQVEAQAALILRYRRRHARRTHTA